jgi:hypothetical protein
MQEGHPVRQYLHQRDQDVPNRVSEAGGRETVGRPVLCARHITGVVGRVVSGHEVLSGNVLGCKEAQSGKQGLFQDRRGRSASRLRAKHG